MIRQYTQEDHQYDELIDEIRKRDEIIETTITYINLFAEDLGYFFHQIKSRLEGKK